MNEKMTEIGKEILLERNGYDYLYEKEIGELFFGAVEFPEEESYILGGLFEFENKFYGLVSVNHT